MVTVVGERRMAKGVRARSGLLLHISRWKSESIAVIQGDRRCFRRKGISSGKEMG